MLREEALFWILKEVNRCYHCTEKYNITIMALIILLQVSDAIRKLTFTVKMNDIVPV